MSEQVASIVIEGWQCDCEIDDSEADCTRIHAAFVPHSATMSQLESGWGPNIGFEVDIGADRLQGTSGLTTAYAHRGKGMNVMAFATFHGIRASAIRAVVVHFAGVVTRIDLQ
jgi:hypothetical protein